MMLPDVLERNLKIVFCGTAVGKKSSKRKLYYVGRGNKFWPVLKNFGFIPENFQPEQFCELPAHGVGLTDLVKTRATNDRALRTENFDVASLVKKIKKYTPAVLAFNGKKAAEIFLGRNVGYGLQEEQIEETSIFVLPSTSGAACRNWDENQWKDLKTFL